MTFSEKLKMLMKKAKISQKELAEKINITEPSMSNYINGNREPRIDVIVNMAHALNVTTDELINDTEVEKKESYLESYNVLNRSKENLTPEEKLKLMKLLLEE